MNYVAGNFTYPPQDSDLQFDYRDSVVTSWVTDDSYPTQVVLSLWYWLYTRQINWTISVIEAVPANGSRSVALDIGVTSDFLAQFNINYNTNDGSRQKYTSMLFHVVHNLREISQTVTWNLQALSTTSLESPTPSKLQTASTEVSVTTSTTTSATTLALTSTVAPKPSNPTPHLAAGIGLGVGISLGIAAMGLIGFLFRKKKKMNSDRRRSRAISQNSGTLVNEGTVTEELDARQSLVELSVGRLDAELDAGHPTLQGAVLQGATAVVR